MSSPELPDIAAILGPLLQRAPADERPLLLAAAERLAAARYRDWAAASDDPDDRAGLLECAEREEAIARSALERQESRGAHSRLDFVGQQDGWDEVNVYTRRDGHDMAVEQRAVVELPDELAEHVAKKV